jgi:hypothetical protein
MKLYKTPNQPRAGEFAEQADYRIDRLGEIIEIIERPSSGCG